MLTCRNYIHARIGQRYNCVLWFPCFPADQVKGGSLGGDDLFSLVTCAKADYSLLCSFPASLFRGFHSGFSSTSRNLHYFVVDVFYQRPTVTTQTHKQCTTKLLRSLTRGTPPRISRDLSAMWYKVALQVSSAIIFKLEDTLANLTLLGAPYRRLILVPNANTITLLCFIIETSLQSLGHLFQVSLAFQHALGYVREIAATGAYFHFRSLVKYSFL
ncbi:hypothetical protein VNO77_24582 [Canavalia gladiata]|uniref:Uncharacterized protein n=1 Tax=Canavalia gladiata TaxID=3824 RepID=A0AAN9L9V8_CANGL